MPTTYGPSGLEGKLTETITGEYMIKKWLGIEKSPKDHYLNGTAFALAGQFEKGIVELSRAIEKEPTFLDAYLHRGIALTDAGHPEKGIIDFDFVIKNDAGKMLAYYNRGVAYIALGKYDLASSDFSEAISLEPEYIDSYAYRYFISVQMKDYDLAVRDAFKMVELGDEKQGYINKATALALKGDTLAAIVDWTNVIEMDSNDHCARCRRGILFEKMGKYEEALSDLKKGLESPDKLPASLLTQSEDLIQKLDKIRQEKESKRQK